jgi:uncharacterized protein YcfJ
MAIQLSLQCKSRATRAAAAASLLVLSACASTGPNSTSAKPVFYPNATLNRVGEPKAREAADACMDRASAAGLTPEENSNAAASGATKGAAVGATAGAVAALVRGRSLDKAVGSGVAGAAVGGSVGAVSGAMRDKPSSTYRRFVQRCLTDQGFDVIGWN